MRSLPCHQSSTNESSLTILLLLPLPPLHSSVFLLHPPSNSLFVCACGSVAHASWDEFLFFFFFFYTKMTQPPQLHQPRRRQAQANGAEPLPRTVEYLRITAFCLFVFILYNVLLFIDRSVDRLPLLLFQCWLEWGAHAAALQHNSCLLPSSQCFCCFHNVIF